MTRFRGIPPRILLGNKWNRAGRSPTNGRCVSTSDRTGTTITSPFDDRRTVVFTSSSADAVIHPMHVRKSALDAGIYDATANYDVSTFNIDLSNASVVAGISDAFFDATVSVPAFRPYSEDKQFEQSNTSSFYMTGSAMTLGAGFTSQLTSKTQIRLTLDHTQQYDMLSTTASIAYYSYASGSFGRVGNVTNPQDAYANKDASDRAVPGFPNPGTTSAMNYAYDARLFGPFGNTVVTGTHPTNTGSYNCPSNLVGQLVSDVLPAFLSVVNTGALTIDPAFAARSSEQIVLDSITQPFLLEKVVIELPFIADKNWINDTTTIVYGGQGQDVGGPCVTVGLMNQMNPTHREVIASGTIIPLGDNISNIYTPLASGLAAPHGFASFAKPTAIVSGSATAGFNGRVRLEITPSVANGAFAAITHPVGAPVTFAGSRVRMLNSFGRSLRRSQSGRSLFGKEFTIPRLDKPPPTLNANPTNRLDIFFFEESSPSTYVIMPGDNLVLAIAKRRSVTTNPTARSAGGDRTVMSASHGVSIGVGPIDITLYGSLIRNGVEFHHGRNEPLTSFAATEVIANDVPALDQFDVSHSSTFTGSFADEYVSGVIKPTSDGSGPDDRSTADEDVAFRRVRGSAVAGTTNKPLTRFVKLRTHDEVYYDSYIPPPEFVQKRDGADISLISFVSFGLTSATDIVASYPLRSEQGTDRMDGLLLAGTINENNDWPFGFPFEPRYGDIAREVFSSGRPATSTNRYVIGGSVARDVVTGSVSKIRFGDAIMRVKANLHNIAAKSSSLEHLQWTTSDLSPVFAARLQQGVFNRGFYGFGDERANQPRFVEPTATDVQSSGGYSYVARLLQTVKIRGWKYGLIDGNSRMSTLVMRRDKHGQFRDVLEPRQYTRFTLNGGNISKPVIVRFTTLDPRDSDSVNVSNEATSSLPYFDGMARN